MQWMQFCQKGGSGSANGLWLRIKVSQTVLTIQFRPLKVALLPPFPQPSPQLWSNNLWYHHVSLECLGICSIVSSWIPVKQDEVTHLRIISECSSSSSPPSPQSPDLPARGAYHSYIWDHGSHVRSPALVLSTLDLSRPFASQGSEHWWISMDRRKVLYLDDHLTIVSGDFRLEFGQYLHCWIHIPTFGGIHVYPLLPLLNILSILQFLLAPSPCVSLISIMTHLSGQTGIFGSFSSDMFRLKIPLFQLRPMSPSSISSQRWTGHLRHWPNKRGGCHQRQWCSIPSIN